MFGIGTSELTVIFYVLGFFSLAFLFVVFHFIKKFW